MNTMTVGELIERLQDFDEGTPVCVTYPYGDYPRNTVGLQVGQHDVDEREMVWSAYHNAWKLGDDGDHEDEERDETDEVFAVCIGALAHGG